MASSPYDLLSCWWNVKHKLTNSGIFFAFPEVCSLSDLANIADGSSPRPGVASCSIWSDCHSIKFRDVPFCKINKIMFADSENQGRKRYFMKI